MPKRIELPSADALFGDMNGGTTPLDVASPPPVRTSDDAPAQPVAKTRAAASPKPRVRSASRSSSPRAARKRAAPLALQRIDRLETQLGAMPIDALLELHDSLEELLTAPTIDGGELSRLLDLAGV